MYFQNDKKRKKIYPRLEYYVFSDVIDENKLQKNSSGSCTRSLSELSNKGYWLKIVIKTADFIFK